MNPIIDDAVCDATCGTVRSLLSFSKWEAAGAASVHVNDPLRIIHQLDAEAETRLGAHNAFGAREVLNHLNQRLV